MLNPWLYMIIVVIALAIIGWLSYYTSTSVYKSLKKNDNQYARLIQVLIAVGMFVILTGLIAYFIISSVKFER